MIKGSVRVTKNAFGKIARAMPGRVSEAVGLSAFDMVGEVQATITVLGAVDEGLLRDSTQTPYEPGDMETVVTTAADYWEHVNYGTHKMAARPFLEPSRDTVQPRHEKRVAAAMKPG